jgi:tRNA threonylcarbamoyladenosine biosynthesis protein TsaB
MRWLAIDGALGPFSAATGSDDGSLEEREAASSGNDALERGLFVVDEVLRGVSPASLDAIAVVTGPGAFTGLRIALSYAKSLAFAASLPLAGITSYDALEPLGTGGLRATFVHGRAGVTCMRLRGHGDDLFRCGTYADVADALAAQLTPGELICCGRAEGAAPALGERGFIVRTMPHDTATPALAALRRAMRHGTPTNPHGVVADYGEQPHYAARSGEGSGV